MQCILNGFFLWFLTETRCATRNEWMLICWRIFHLSWFIRVHTHITVGTRPISRDKVNFFSLLFGIFLFTYHFSSQFWVGQLSAFDICLCRILWHKSHKFFCCFKIVWVLNRCVLCWVPCISSVVISYFSCLVLFYSLLPLVRLSADQSRACIGLAWLPNIFHFGIIRARELLLLFFFLCSFSSTHTRTHLH